MSLPEENVPYLNEFLLLGFGFDLGNCDQNWWVDGSLPLLASVKLLIACSVLS